MVEKFQSDTIAGIVAATTAGFGILSIIKDNVGWMAALAGLILSIVLIYSHIKKGRLERRLLQLKIEQAENDRVPSKINKR